jgi:hypothetical protein
MRGVIAALMAILGVILVLGGAASLWASAVARSRAGESRGGEFRAGESTPATPSAGTRLERTLDVAGRLPGADRLITWGVVLLALSAVAAGAITFSATATAGTN